MYCCFICLLCRTWTKNVWHTKKWL